MKLDGFEIKPHEFKHKIEIERYSNNNVDLDNIPCEEQWNSIITTKAKIVLNQNDEKQIMDGTSKVTIKTFYIRYRKDTEVTNKDRINYNGSIWEIQSVNDIKEAHVYLEIKAKLIE